MPVTISDKDYKEYRILQHNSIFQQKLDSVITLRNLKEDIDIPIRNLVATFALLGCEPRWSCCGFDYDGQPLHKTHEYGNTYIVLRDTIQSRKIIDGLLSNEAIKLRENEELDYKTDQWVIWTSEHWIYLVSDFDYYHKTTNYPWSKNSCIHYPELALIKINYLGWKLFKLFGNELLDVVTLSDTNKRQKENLVDWQYPILEDWIIHKEDIFRSIK
jgi:hypothetical protein